MKIRKVLGKILAGAMGLCLGISAIVIGLPANQVSAEENAVQTTADGRMPFRELTATEIVAEMGAGWNLGNTMDGHTGFTPSETIWQNVETTQALLKEIHDMGFNTVRVPVTWGTMIDDANGYAIDEKWMSRVQDIVDYAVNMNMYVIINIHHDGAEQSGWLRIGAKDIKPVEKKFAAVWGHIAERFKDYDEHVIFESMNEVTGSGTTIAADTAVINALNQIFVDTVRATRSNNAVRWLSVPGRYTNIYNTSNPENGFILPNDSVKNRLFIAVHSYDWHFGLLETTQKTTYSYDAGKALQAEFKDLETFTKQGIPIILGEYGAINKQNTPDRAYYMEIVSRICQQMGIVPCYWDQGWYDLSLDPDFSFTLVDRETCEQIYPEIIRAMMRGTFLKGKADLTDIELDPKTTVITDLGSISGTYLLKMGEVFPITLNGAQDKASTNDVVLWKSADESIATVEALCGDLTYWNANIHATGIGNTIITAYSQNGGAVLEIPVEVKAAKTENPCTEINVQKDSYTLISGQHEYLGASMAPANTDAFLTYRSSDEAVVTVSKIGKLVAKNTGSAYVIVSSSDGLTKVVPVTVEEAESKAEIALALNVYYNDNGNNYFSNETGSVITVSENGQYTLSFDCSKDLSANAKTAGVLGLSSLTAIYIKDDSVTKGIAKKSPLVSCDIIYDSIKVDGTECAITMTEPKSALKASGIFDTNDPINSWDGSVIENVKVSNHVLSFADIDNPQKIEVTFTLTNLVFEEGAEGVAKAEAKTIEVVGEKSVKLPDAEPFQISVKVDPTGDHKVTFASSNTAVAVVGSKAVAVDGDGIAVAQVYAHGNGSATITAYTENGISTSLEVKVDSASQKEYINASADALEKGKEVKAANSTPNMILIVLGIIALAVVVFFITLKIAGGTGTKKK